MTLDEALKKIHALDEENKELRQLMIGASSAAGEFAGKMLRLEERVKMAEEAAKKVIELIEPYKFGSDGDDEYNNEEIFDAIDILSKFLNKESE